MCQIIWRKSQLLLWDYCPPYIPPPLIYLSLCERLLHTCTDKVPVALFQSCRALIKPTMSKYPNYMYMPGCWNRVPTALKPLYSCPQIDRKWWKADGKWHGGSLVTTCDVTIPACVRASLLLSHGLTGLQQRDVQQQIRAGLTLISDLKRNTYESIKEGMTHTHAHAHTHTHTNKHTDTCYTNNKTCSYAFYNDKIGHKLLEVVVLLHSAFLYCGSYLDYWLKTLEVY